MDATARLRVVRLPHSGRRHNLPAQPTPLIGRSREVEAVRRRLLDEDVRLLTLTGPAGTGKTRLAVEVAGRLVDAVADGVFFVDLVPVREPGSVPAAIARALDLQDRSPRPVEEALRAYLEPRQVLLLLDNVEHVLAAAPLVAGLIA